MTHLSKNACIQLGVVLVSLCLGCETQQSNVSRSVCEAARKQCKRVPMACLRGETYLELECGCGCVDDISLKRGMGRSELSSKQGQEENSTAGRSSAVVSGTDSQQTQRVVSPSTGLPGSDRVFSLDIDGDGVDELIAGHDDRVWLYTFEGSELKTLDVPADGVLQAVTIGQWQGHRAIFLGFGRGRGRLNVPVQVFVSSGDLSAWQPVFREKSSRSDISFLAYSNDERNGPGEGILVGFYSSKYLVKTVLVNPNVTKTVHGPQRMAGNVVYWKLSNQPVALKVVGRIYGDSKGEPGDLFLHEDRGGRRQLPISGGVRALITAETRSVGERRLYVSDGWSAAYAKEARAQLKEIRREKDTFIVSKIGSSEGEFTFFELWTRDLNGDGLDEIVARGNKHLTQFSRTAEGWRAKRLASFTSVLNAALLKVSSGSAPRWGIAVPNAQETKLIFKSSAEVSL